MTNQYKMYDVAQYKVTRRCKKPANRAKNDRKPVTGEMLENIYRFIW